MKAEMMHAAISKESPVSSGFQLNEDDVQKIEGVVTGGSQGLMKIMPQVENAVKLLKLFTNQMFSGFQTFYRLPTQASDIESVDDGVLSQTTTRPQESSVQAHDTPGHRRGMASLFTNVGQQIGALLEQQPQALAQQLGMNSNTVNEPPHTSRQLGSYHSVLMGRAEPMLGAVNRKDISSQPRGGDSLKAEVANKRASDSLHTPSLQSVGSTPKLDAAMLPAADRIATLTQQILGDSQNVNVPDVQTSGGRGILGQQAQGSLPWLNASIIPAVDRITTLTQQILGDSQNVNAPDVQTSGVSDTALVPAIDHIATLTQQVRDSVPKINVTIGQALEGTAPAASHGQQSVKKGVMPGLASVMQHESVKMITDSLDYVKGKYGGGVIDTMRKLVKNPLSKRQNVIAGSSANQDEDHPALSTTGLLANHSIGPAEVSSRVGSVVPVKQSITAAPVIPGTQRLDSLAQKLLVNLQPGVNSLSQLVNQWPIGDSTQTMEHVGAISKSLQIEPSAILNLSNPSVVSGLMGELTVQDTRRYPYASGASLTLTQPTTASHNLNQTTTINVYGAAEPQVTANEIEARQTNIHSRLSQQLSGGPR